MKTYFQENNNNTNPTASKEENEKYQELISLFKVLYSDTFVIIGFQNKFLEELKQRITSSKEIFIGDLFLNFVVYMKTYSTYMNHYQRIVPILSSMKNAPIGFKLDSLKNDLCKGKGLKDFLIMPVQRIPRYALLLRVLLSFPSLFLFLLFIYLLLSIILFVIYILFIINKWEK